MRPAGIVGLGFWAPDRVVRNDAWPESFAHAFYADRKARRERDFTLLQEGVSTRPYDELYTRHGTSHENDPFKGAVERRVQSPDVPTVEGDCIAARLALQDARIKPSEIDLVLSSALVPDRIVPSNGPAIQHLTGCVNAPGICVESHCSAPLAQLDLAAALVESGRARWVLCVQSHQIGRILDLEQPFSPMFGDASSAFVVGEASEATGVIDFVRGGDGSLADAVIHDYKERPGAVWWRDASGPVRPGSADLAAARRLGNSMLGYAIDTIRELCEKTHLPLDAAAAICMVQPLAWLQSAVAEALGVVPERVPSTFRTYAHVGGVGVIANLLEARRNGLLRERAPVILYAHGAGMTRYACLMRWDGCRSA